MKNSNEIMSVAIPTPEAADLTTRAAQAGVPTDEFLGIQVLAGAYGNLHPAVIEFRNRANKGINGPKTQGDSEAQ